jgi:hypothetical protein
MLKTGAEMASKANLDPQARLLVLNAAFKVISSIKNASSPTSTGTMCY